MSTQRLKTYHSKTTILIKLMVGAVFISQGCQKFLFPALRGAGRFEKGGLLSPGFMGSFVGAFEWEMMHGSRTVLAMLPGSIFLLIKGGAFWSADKILTQNAA